MTEQKTGPQAAPAPVIRVVSLVKQFEGRRVLDGVSLDVLPGEVMVIMGGSGCGKSTLLRQMIAAIEPDAGRVELFGLDIAELTDRQLDDVRKRFGILFQSGALFQAISVGDNVALPLREHTDLPEQDIAVIVKMKLELVGLRHAAHLMPAELSGGMRKRAALARAIAMDPEILFYDEPSAGLDPVSAACIDQLIIDLSGRLGVASVVVTHEMDSAFRIADRMAMLDEGRILKTGPREQFEQLRDSEPTGDNAHDLIRQFLRGDGDGPLTRRRLGVAYEKDILDAAGG